MPEEMVERIKALIEDHMDMFEDMDMEEGMIRAFLKGFSEGIRKGIHEGYRDAYHLDEGAEDDFETYDEMTKAADTRPDGRNDKDDRNGKEDPKREEDENRRKEKREKDEECGKDNEVYKERNSWKPKALLQPLEVIEETFTSEGFHLAFEMTDLRDLISFEIGIRAYYDEDGSVVPQAGGIEINIAGYPYKARDTQVALIAEGSSYYNEKYNVWIHEDDDDVYILEEEIEEDEEEDPEEDEDSRIDPGSLIGHIIPVFIDNDGEVFEPLWQDYHRSIREDENLWGYSYSEYHLGAFSFTRDQVPSVDNEEDDPEEDEDEGEDPEEDEEEEDPEEDEDESREENDDTIGLINSSGDDSASKDAGSVLSSTLAWAVGIGTILAVLAGVLVLGILLYARKR
jgi:acylphosphatase